jgi:hypothetical protein
MEIKQASSIDLIDVLYLLKMCVLDMNGRGLKQWNSVHPSPEMIIEDIEKGTLYIYNELKIAQGMINLSNEAPAEYKDINWKGKTDKVLYVKRFAVHPLWMESEVPVSLINFAEKFAKENNYSTVRIDLLDSYPVGEKFFTSRNFSIAGNFHSEFQKLSYTCYEKNL